MERSLKFRQRAHDRYWWYRAKETDYLPPVFSVLSDDEWQTIDNWFEDTEVKFPGPAELGVPGMSMLMGMIGGSGIGRVVQCGHYAGFSTLMLGFLLRSMRKKKCLFSVDIDPKMTEYTLGWVKRAGLEDYVQLLVSDSADPKVPSIAEEYLGGAPSLVFIDSSHQYQHTLAELDLWYNVLTNGGFICLHDTSQYAQNFDATHRGGVLRAVAEWTATHKIPNLMINGHVDGSQTIDSVTYKDGCGFGILQKQGSSRVASRLL